MGSGSSKNKRPAEEKKIDEKNTDSKSRKNIRLDPVRIGE